MSKAATINAKYVFLDVVGFARDRSVEAQADIVHALNKIVRRGIAAFSVGPPEKLILIPTGDGMCIALLDVEAPFDVHIGIALNIMKGIHRRNTTVSDEKRKFEVRVGINSNIDNLVTDINGQPNIAGAGINMASRLMDMADGNQILVGQSVFDTVCQRDKYRDSFKPFKKTIKHGTEPISVYQLISNGYEGLNTQVPEAFQASEPDLDRFMAYYFAHSIRLEAFLPGLLEKLYCEAQIGIILLWFLALGSERGSGANLYTSEGCDEGFLEQRLKYYDSLDWDLKQSLVCLITDRLEKYDSDFEQQDFLKHLLVNTKGKKKLADFEGRKIWYEFQLYRYWTLVELNLPARDTQ